jgi:hypothetical protein
MNRIARAAGIAALTLLTGCGDGGSEATAEAGPAPAVATGFDPAGGSGGSGSSGPTGAPTWATQVTPPPSATQPSSSAKLVTPRSGMANIHPQVWTWTEHRGPQVVRVHYRAGIEPCTVLDSVRVEYRKDAIVISLFSGSDPAAADRACIEVVQSTAVDVTLSEAQAGRAFIDGASGRPGATAEPAAG